MLFQSQNLTFNQNGIIERLIPRRDFFPLASDDSCHGFLLGPSHTLFHWLTYSTSRTARESTQNERFLGLNSQSLS